MSEGVMKNNCSKGSPGAVEKQRKRLNHDTLKKKG